MMRKYITTLTIAGSDCSGGAGIQADLKTFSALGCYGMSVITALTAQNTRGVQAIYSIAADFISQQLNSIFADIKVNAIKIGMLFSEEIIKAVKECLKNHPEIPLVLDPVMVSKNGCILLPENIIQSLITQLFPLATVLTPNISEAEYILKKTIHNQDEMQYAALEISSFGSQSVLIKGGHLATEESADCLYDCNKQKFYWFKTRRIATINTHGTGCTLSAAIAAYLAHGESLFHAIDQAKKYITKAINAGSEYYLGSGHGPVKH